MALQAVIASGGAAWHEELGTEGLLHLACVTALASSWLAEASRSDSPAGLASDDQEAAAQSLTAVWQALAQPRAAALLRGPERTAGSWLSGRSSLEAAALRRDLEASLSQLEAPASAQQLRVAARPAQDFLPPKLRSSMTAATRKCSPALAKPVATATAAPTAEANEANASGGSLLQTAGQALEYAAWAAIIGAAIVVASEDGLGWLRVHGLPVPWRAAWRSALLERSVHVEELLAKYDPLPESNSIMLGPRGAQ